MQRNTFEYNNRNYELNISIQEYNENPNKQADVKKYLSTERISMFTYTNTLNNLYTTGTLDYLDTEGIIAKYQDKDNVVIIIDFKRKNIETEGNLKVSKTNEYEKLSLTMYVNKILIKHQHSNEIAYHLELLGIQCLGLIKKVEYSNYDDKKERIVDIILKLLTNYGLNTDPESFNNCKSNSMIDYISNGQSNVSETIKWLQSRLFTFEQYQKDSELNCLVYDDRKNFIKIIDINHVDMSQNAMLVHIDMMRNEGNLLVDKQESQLGKLDNLGKLKAQTNYAPNRVTVYDMENNEFLSRYMESLELANYFNNGNQPQTQNAKIFDSHDYEVIASEWAQDMNKYDDMFQKKTQTDAIRVNTYGEMCVVPGDSVNLQLKLDMTNSQYDNTENVKDKIKSYDVYRGYWKVFEVTNFIDPASCVFRQNLQLFRPTELKVISDTEKEFQMKFSTQVGGSTATA